jgi:hypothetical protein
VWDPDAGELLSAVEAPGGDKSNVCRMRLFESDDGRYLLATMQYNGSLRIWDLGEAPQRVPQMRAATKLG